MEKLVCDRCGAPAGTCDHVRFESYRAVTQREFSFSRCMQWMLIILFLIVLGLATRQVINYSREVVPIGQEARIRV